MSLPPHRPSPPASPGGFAVAGGGGDGRVVIRELGTADLDAVVAIEARVNPRPWSRQLLAEELDLPPANRHWLVVTEDHRGSDRPNTILGYGGVMYAPDAAHLMLLGVDPDRRRRGLGLRLCLDLFDEARRRGAGGLTLEVRVGNRAAVTLYERLAMTAVGVRPRYYPDGEDAMIFWIHDLAEPQLIRHHTELRAGLELSTAPTMVGDGRAGSSGGP